MDISERTRDDTTILTISGSFNFSFSAREEFNAAVQKAQDAGARCIVVSLELVSFIDSAALGMLVLAHQSLKRNGVKIVLAHPQEYVHQILNLLNISAKIPIYPSLEKAMADNTSRPFFFKDCAYDFS